MERAVALTAVRAAGVTLAATSEYDEASFVPAESLFPGCDLPYEFIPAPVTTSATTVLVYRDGVFHLQSSFPYYVATGQETLRAKSFAPFADCLTVHGREATEGLLDFGARAAKAQLGPFQFIVHPQPPLSANAYQRMLADVTRCASQLLFDCGGPTSFGMVQQRAGERQSLYPLFRFLRHSMTEAPADERLGCCFSQILHSPHHRTFRERELASIHAGRRIGPATLAALAQRPEYLTVLGSESRLGEVALGRRLARARQSYFPERIVSERIQTSYDTAENRFVKHMLMVVQTVLERAAEAFAGQSGFLARATEAEARALVAECRRYRRADFLKHVGQLRRFPAQSQVLRKRTGYRELTRFWHLLFLASQVSWRELAQIESRRLDVLYEYWAFFIVVDIIRRLYGQERALRVDMLQPTREGLLLDLGREGQVRLDFRARPGRLRGSQLAFCRTFAHGSVSATVELQPTMTVEKSSGELLVLDVSFMAPTAANEASGDDVIRQRRVLRLHGLRDALSCQAAIGLVPDGQSCWFPARHAEDASSGRGVGLISLRPGDGEGIRAVGRLLHDFLRA